MINTKGGATAVFIWVGFCKLNLTITAAGNESIVAQVMQFWAGWYLARATRARKVLLVMWEAEM